MSLRASVISPYQKFYGTDGITPLSGGSIVFYENGTTDLLAIYSDNDLTIPQDNPYNLDGGGAINGDVYFGTLATLVTYDGPDMTGDEIKTFNDVSCFDQATLFGLWDATVVYNDDGSATNIVQSPVSGFYYISIQDNNLNHEPSVSPLWWTQWPLPSVEEGDLFVGNGTGIEAIPAGATGTVLTSTGAGSIPAWVASSDTLLREARTSNTILGLADKGKFIDITSGTFSQTFDACATLLNGWFIWLRNSGTGDITLEPDGAELIDGLTNYIMYPGEARLVQCSGTALTTILVTPFSNKTFTSTAAFIMPPGYNGVVADVVSAGAGGNRPDVGDPSKGGGGGGGGGRSGPVPVYGIAAGTSITCTIGAGGTGASANGTAGSAGGNSSFGAYVVITGGLASASVSSGGSGGAIAAAHSSATAAGGTGASGGSTGNGTSAEYGGGGGGGGNGSGVPKDGGGSVMGGGAGGGGASSNSGAGGVGGLSKTYSSGGGAAGGTAGGATGGNGTGGTAGSNGFGGGGGGGGGGGSSTGGMGGSGAIPGGGGGGGGCAGTTTGNGGDGARGEIRVSGSI